MPSNGPAPIGRKPPASPAPPPPVKPRESIVITYTGGANSTEHVEIFEDRRGGEPIRGISQTSDKPYSDGILRHTTGPAAETIQRSYANEVARARSRTKIMDREPVDLTDDDRIFIPAWVVYLIIGLLGFSIGLLF